MPPFEKPDVDPSSSPSTSNIACVARDEAASLRTEICKLRLTIQEMEEERAFTAAKTGELEDTLRSFKKEDIHEEFVKKSQEVTELNANIETMNEKIKKMTVFEVRLKRTLLKERKDNQAKLEKLTALVRSLQCSSSEEEESVEGNESKILTPDEALDLTIKNLKFHIEFLEDERQTLAVKCSDRDKKVSELEKDLEMKDVKIRMLEELCREKNEGAEDGPEESLKPPLTKTKSAPDVVKGGRRRRARCSTENKGPRRTPARGSLSSRSPSTKEITVYIGDKEGVYAGPMRDGKPNGVGTIRFTNGETYLGEVQDGELHGVGAYYSKTNVYRGRFEHNEQVPSK